MYFLLVFMFQWRHCEEMKYLHVNVQNNISFDIKSLFKVGPEIYKSSEETTMVYLSQKVTVTSVCVGGQWAGTTTRVCVCVVFVVPPADSIKAKVSLSKKIWPLFFLICHPVCPSGWGDTLQYFSFTAFGPPTPFSRSPSLSLQGFKQTQSELISEEWEQRRENWLMLTLFSCFPLWEGLL